MNPEIIRSQFPLLTNNPDIVYLDSASTTLIPKAGIDAVCDFLNNTVVSSRRGAHTLAVRGGSAVEATRKKLASFLNSSPAQISFQKSLPSAVTSFTLGYDWKKNKHDTILVAESEEHSVLVPLQRVANLLDLQIHPIPINNEGSLDLSEFENLLNDRTGIVAVGTTTMGWGNRNPIERITKLAHEHGSLVLSDMSRTFAFDLREALRSGIDIAIFSGNTSLMSPPGLCLQYTEENVAKHHIPGIIGGSAVTNVDSKKSDIALQPDKFESGMLNVPAITGLGCAIDTLNEIGKQHIESHLKRLANHTIKRLTENDSIRLFGTPNEKSSIFGFNLGDEDLISCHDIALFLDESNIAVRSGLLCAHPLVKKVSSEGIIQASLSIYNSITDIDSLADTLNIISKDLL